MSDLYGWFSGIGQKVPEHDPPVDAPCPYCGNPMSHADIRTHCFVAMEVDRRERSWFYRVHKSCDDDASEGQRMSIFDGVVAAIKAETGKAA